MKNKWGIYWAHPTEEVATLKADDFYFVQNVAEFIDDFEEVLEWGLIQCDKDSWFVDGYPGTLDNRGGYTSGRFVVRNFETREQRVLNVETEFTPSFFVREE